MISINFITYLYKIFGILIYKIQFKIEFKMRTSQIQLVINNIFSWSNSRLSTEKSILGFRRIYI